MVPALVAQMRISRDELCFARLRVIATSLLMYLQDYDEIMPLAFGRGPDGNWLANYAHAVPYDWRPTQTSWRSAYASTWANTLVPYLPERGIEVASRYDWLHCPVAIATKPSGITDYSNPQRRPAKVSYTYNGLLHQLSLARVSSPATVPSFWEGRGRSYTVGFAVSNPTLRCPPNSDCRYMPRREEMPPCGAVTGTMFTPDSMWIHPKGTTMAFVDGHVVWRRLGLVIAPNNTNPDYDPFTGYNSSGIPAYFWFDDCNPWLFRPY